MVLLCLQNYETQRMDYFAYTRTLRRLDCREEQDAIRVMNRFSCDDPSSPEDISAKSHPLSAKLSFKLPLDQTAPGSVRTRVIMGVAGLFDKGVPNAIKELLIRQGVSVKANRLVALEGLIKRIRMKCVLAAAGVVGVAVAGTIAVNF